MLNPSEVIDSMLNTRFRSDYVGVVEDHNDPAQIGRVKVRVKELYGTIPVQHLPWANPDEPFGGDQEYGFFLIPKPGAKVRVRLWRGHPWYPIWTGVHWFRGQPPDESEITPPHNYVLKTPSGHLIDLHDDNRYIRIKDRKGNYIIFRGKENFDDLMIYFQKDGKFEFINNLNIVTGRNLRLEVGGNLDVRVKGEINVLADGDMNEDAANIYHNSGKASPESPDRPGDVSHRQGGG